MAEIPGVLPPKDAVAVIFVAQRREEDEAGYAEAAARMEALASTQPGYLGIDSVRNGDGLGITVSWWADEESATGWKQEAEHAAVREMGRTRWYTHYRLIVAEVARAYAWARKD